MGDQRGHMAGEESARRRVVEQPCPCTTRIHVAGFIRTRRGCRHARAVADVRDTTTAHSSGYAPDTAPCRLPSDEEAQRRVVRIPQRVQLVGTRSIAFEVLAVTQFSPHCVRISLLAEKVERCELTSGQELSLGRHCSWGALPMDREGVQSAYETRHRWGHPGTRFSLCSAFRDVGRHRRDPAGASVMAPHRRGAAPQRPCGDSGPMCPPNEG